MKTVSDSKRSFHSFHPRPINSVYRRVIEELLVEMHLLSVNADFKQDPIYCLGVVSSFERLMQGYKPEKDKESIFNGLCRAVEADPELYKSQAGSLLTVATRKSADEIITWLKEPNEEIGTDIVEPIKAIATNDNFKYSRPFAIGLYTLLEEADAEMVKDKEKLEKVADTIAEDLGLPGEKMKKDLDSYRSNLEKMDQLLKVIEDVLEASRKKREKRAQEQETKEVSEATAES